MGINIEQELRHMSVLTPSQAFQEDAKRRLFSKIQKKDSFWVVRVLKNIFKPLPSAEFVEQAFSRIMHRIEKPKLQVQESLLSLVRSFLFSHKYVSLVLTGVFVCVFVITIPQTSANAKTELLVDFGTVEVKSLGEDWKKVDDRAVLKIGDQVRTKNNSLAEILFPNYSVVRIAGNTSVNVAQLLQSENQNDLVVLKLQEGRLWSSIISEKQDFIIETRQSRVSTHFGIFDIQANQQTLVQSMQNTVNVEPRILVGAEKILLSAGFATSISDTSTQAVKMSEDAWSKENQQKDKILRAEIFAKEQKELKNIAGILPGSPLYDVKQAVAALSSKTLEDIRSEFAASKLLMASREENLAMEQFEQAKSDLQTLWSLSSNQAQNQQDILSYLDEEKIFFSQMLPSDVLVKLKPLFQELFIAYASNPQQEQMNQVAEKMLEVQNLVVQEDISDASLLLVASLDNFLIQNQQIIDQSLQTNSKADMEKLLSLQTRNLQVLQDITENIEDKDAQTKAEAVRSELVNTIQNIVSKLAPEQKPVQNVNNNQAHWFASQIKIIVKKIETYESERGRLNTLHWILESIDNKKENLGFLYALKDALPENSKLPVSKKILKIRQQKEI